MRPELLQRLALAFEWYRRMVSPETGRLAYTYDPEDDALVVDGSGIRSIASIWDVALLSKFLGRSELRPVIDRSLDHYTSMLVRDRAGVVLDPARLGEPSGIAHSAFLVLALLAADRRERVDELVAALLTQQRADGSYRIYFGDHPDDGLELYPAEAMLAILEAYAATREPRYLASVERAFSHQRERMPANRMLVFYANWQAQYGALLHRHSRACQASVRDFIFSLHDRVIRSGFYERVESAPDAQATVEVACGLEGIADAYAIAAREHDIPRMAAYERCAWIALGYLLRAQRRADCASRECGGFGHTLADRTQRIDVTGHVVAGFIKCVRDRITVEV